MPTLNVVVVTKTYVGAINFWTNVNDTVGLAKCSKGSMARSKTLKRRTLSLQGTLRRCKHSSRLNSTKMQSGVDISTNNYNAVITLQPKFDCASNRANKFNPNFLKRTPNLKRRLGM